MLLWFGIVVAIFCIAGEWSVVYFGVTYGLGFGGIAYKLRKKVRPFFQRMGLDNYGGFLLLTMGITITEETYCYLLEYKSGCLNPLHSLFFCFSNSM